MRKGEPRRLLESMRHSIGEIDAVPGNILEVDEEGTSRWEAMQLEAEQRGMRSAYCEYMLWYSASASVRMEFLQHRNGLPASGESHRVLGKAEPSSSWMFMVPQWRPLQQRTNLCNGQTWTTRSVRWRPWQRSAIVRLGPRLPSIWAMFCPK